MFFNNQPGIYILAHGLGNIQYPSTSVTPTVMSGIISIQQGSIIFGDIVLTPTIMSGIISIQIGNISVLYNTNIETRIIDATPIQRLIDSTPIQLIKNATPVTDLVLTLEGP